MADRPRDLARRPRLLRAETARDEETVHEWRDEFRRTIHVEHEFFDRVRFARRALDVLRPPGLSVLIRHGYRELRVDSGEDWARPGCAWATLAIPRDATREEIVLALLELVGAREDPYWLDVLLHLPRED